MKNVFKHGIPIFELLDNFDTEDFTLDKLDLAFGYNDVDTNLVNFLKLDVMTDYLCNIDRSHSIEHIIDVAKNSLDLADRLNANKNVAITAAVYHELGRVYDSDPSNNHMISYNAMMIDSSILKGLCLSDSECRDAGIAIIENSVYVTVKTSIYSKILTDADLITSLLDTDYMIKRYLNYILINFTYKSTSEMLDMAFDVINKRYNIKENRSYISIDSLGTSIGKKIYKDNIDNILEICEDKSKFIHRVENLIIMENNKRKARG